MAIFIITQLILYIININKNSDPQPLSEPRDIVNDIFGLPIYKNFLISEKWAFFFSFGITRFQIVSFITEILMLIMCFYYLDYYSYSIFEVERNSEFNIYQLSERNRIVQSIESISEKDYNKVD